MGSSAFDPHPSLVIPRVRRASVKLSSVLSMTRRSKSVITISKRALAVAVSLRGRLRANNRRGDGGNKERNNGAQERNLSIAITRKQSRTVLETRNGNFIIFVLCFLVFLLRFFSPCLAPTCPAGGLGRCPPRYAYVQFASSSLGTVHDLELPQSRPSVYKAACPATEGKRRAAGFFLGEGTAAWNIFLLCVLLVYWWQHAVLAAQCFR
jgi:hypothetical protein